MYLPCGESLRSHCGNLKANRRFKMRCVAIDTHQRTFRNFPTFNSSPIPWANEIDGQGRRQREATELMGHKALQLNVRSSHKTTLITPRETKSMFMTLKRPTTRRHITRENTARILKEMRKKTRQSM